MRLVLDTNVVMSALLWRGKPYLLPEAIRQRSDVQLVSSAALLGELADVLTRSSATKRLALIGKTAREVLADYAEVIELVEPTSVPRVVPGDADDDQVIAAAVAAGAALIASGDSDLLSMGSHQGIEIVSAAMAVESVGARSLSDLGRRSEVWPQRGQFSSDLQTHSCSYGAKSRRKMDRCGQTAADVPQARQTPRGKT